MRIVKIRKCENKKRSQENKCGDDWQQTSKP